ncbi:hypothetical protein Tco_0363593 [Tanacetum coccineum]
MTNGRETTPPLGFSTLPHIPNINTTKRPPVTTTVFAATTLGNTLFAYRASTLTDPAPMITPDFVEANYEILESLLRDRRRQIRNEDLRTELEYFRFEEAPNREGNRIGSIIEGNRPLEVRAEENGRREMNLPSLLAAHLGRNEDGQPLRSSLTSVHGGRQSSINTGWNLPPNSTLISHHAQPFIPNSVHVPNGFVPTHIIPYYQPSTGIINGQAPSLSFPAQTDPTGSVTPFVCWIEEYPLPDGLKMPSHNSQKAGSILNYEDLKAKFRSHFSQQKRFTKSHLAVHNIKQREGESVRAFANRNLVEHLSTDLLSTYKGLMEKTYTWIEAREVATNRAPNDRRDNFERSRKSSWDNGRGQRSRDKFSPYQGPNHGLLSSLSKSLREILAKEKLRSQIEEAVRSGQIFHLEEGRIRNNISKSPTFEGREITFPPVTKDSNSSAPVIIKAKIFGKEVGRVHMDSVPLVGFSGEKSWAIREVLLEITIGNAPLTRSETLNFVIVRSNSPYNMLLGRTTMQKIGMIVSMIHEAVKFHTTQAIRTVFLTYEFDKTKCVKKVRETSLANTIGVLSCTDAEEKIIVNNKYPEQTVTIGKQLPEHFKERLQNLLWTNADVFAWTHADMMRIPITIIVNGKPFNMGHKLNEYSHIKPIKI